MINITREESTVKVLVEGGPLGSTYQFEYPCNNKFYAELLCRHFQERLEQKIEAIRKYEYQRGWDDHKKRKPKADWFYSSLTNNNYGK